MTHPIHELIRRQAEAEYPDTTKTAATWWDTNVDRRQAFIAGRTPLAELILDMKEFCGHKPECGKHPRRAFQSPCSCGWEAVEQRINQLTGHELRTEPRNHGLPARHEEGGNDSYMP